MHWQNWEHGWWHMGWMWVFWVLILALLIWLALAFISRVPRDFKDARRTAADILKERYARGEIGREEYERMLGDLRR